MCIRDRLWETTMNPENRMLKQVHLENAAEADYIFSMLMGEMCIRDRNAVSRTLEEESIISQELVDEICDENRDVPLVDMSVLDVAPQEYKLSLIHI